MWFIPSTLATVAVFAGLMYAPIDASAQERGGTRSYDKYDRYSNEERDWRALRRLVPGYQARNPDNFRFGSDAWWKAMDREGRGGHPRL